MQAPKVPYDFIAIEGNIGSGKTSLANKLSTDLGSRLILEEFEDNSFLPKFYDDPRRYAFPLEMSFLAARFNQLKTLLSSASLFENKVISDYVFAKCLLFSRVNLDEDEYDLYSKLFNIIQLQLAKPDLLLYLHTPVEKLVWNILNRGRTYESKISESYLVSVQNAYFDWLNQQKDQVILMIDCSRSDFVKQETDYQALVEAISQTYIPGIHRISL